ncbi:aldo/keto reductase [Pseudooceanicola sediminis]|uniref:Aldo/keto reductase n=1 Tax=Pseudooceanicola sediminis TaxID=2211117 RepID=A0A399J3I2_9RHOB|nr:aldo/keto reductase [Pseudooceanicola sediminis]KAA2313681.1 aldo/keto reductase [Puniceibacterium sp. HSS470]RII38482.1 aldo/keto reductase [Pseudooceanicola sediminis]
MTDLPRPDRFSLAPGYEISRVLRGNWQLAGGHGAVDRAEAVEDMIAFADAGITTFDCADIYTGVEELIGQFRAQYLNRRGAEALAEVRVHTKCVPDLAKLATLTRDQLQETIDRSRARLGVERLDLVQFHWWDYSAGDWLQAARWLEEFRIEGRIQFVSGTNFDTDHVAAMLAAGVPIRTMQVQYSLLDRRPEKRMADLAAEAGVNFLCYGTVAGGFLSDRWLGVADPGAEMENRSLIKYKLIIDDLGGWDLFQALLGTLRGIADAHGSDIATVASAAMLSRPQVAGVIVGARNRAHLASNLAISALRLSDRDLAQIDAVLAQGHTLEGDVYTLERDRTGRHGAIMKYNLNKEEA